MKSNARIWSCDQKIQTHAGSSRLRFYIVFGCYRGPESLTLSSDENDSLQHQQTSQVAFGLHIGIRFGFEIIHPGLGMESVIPSVWFSTRNGVRHSNTSIWFSHSNTSIGTQMRKNSMLQDLTRIISRSEISPRVISASHRAYMSWFVFFLANKLGINNNIIQLNF